MKILYLTFYFEPDLSPGSFRNTSLVNELSLQLPEGSQIRVITTQPNRYKSYKPSAPEHEDRRSNGCRVTIDRINIPSHKGGQFDQIRSFWTYFWAALRLTKSQEYDLIFASSSRLFTAFLGAVLARRERSLLVLDIRDLFREGILEVHKNPLIHLILNPVLRLVENITFRSANHINLVSEGFRSYFSPYTQATYSYYTNGIDDMFLDFTSFFQHRKRTASVSGQITTILYAGNIGDGQGLHKIIPQAARQLGDRYRFVVIGDGSAKLQLENAIRAENVLNVDLRKPISRAELIANYQYADYLLVHLNDLDVCNRVLPSKLFDYGVTDKPILAGVAGFAASFVRTHLNNSLLFPPGDVTSMIRHLHESPYRTEVRTEFTRRFQRKTISRDMARQIRKLLDSRRLQKQLFM
ncbi:glycosyltransferase family 4 protein [Spirosoma sp. KNUC1025]|uniref:glycosyltransferase family 4 protein n=1 Tax=Spirosoma sp. KNUC1025 TaxID=2894082 RepID=UPI00386C7BD2|nr:glycosyltransferase family 4 protein [Spirosoma sp. KNUC1025]